LHAHLRLHTNLRLRLLRKATHLHPWHSTWHSPHLHSLLRTHPWHPTHLHPWHHPTHLHTLLRRALLGKACGHAHVLCWWLRRLLVGLLVGHSARGCTES
jgi:hypothetical protein